MHDYLEDESYSQHLAEADIDEILSQLLVFLSDDNQIFNPSFDDPQSDSFESANVIESKEHICDKFGSFCEKTSFIGSFTESQKSSYLEDTMGILISLDTALPDQYSLENTLKAIDFFLSKWNRRGSSSWYKMTFHLWSLLYDDEFIQVLTHELWHILDLWTLQWTSKRKSWIFTEFAKSVFSIDDPSLEYYSLSRESENIRKSGQRKRDFCSWYGMSDPFEDFAECHNLYLNHQDLFRLIAKDSSTLKNKYNYFANLYRWMFFSKTDDLEDFTSTMRVWDTTRISER